MSLQKAPPEEAQVQRAVSLAEALAILQTPVREVLGTPPWCLSGSWSLSGEGRATEGHMRSHRDGVAAALTLWCTRKNTEGGGRDPGRGPGAEPPFT